MGMVSLSNTLTEMVSSHYFVYQSSLFACLIIGI